MTSTELQAQLDAVIANLGITKAEYQGRMMQFPEGTHRLQEIAYLMDAIQQAQDVEAGVPTTRCTFASFNRS